MIISKKELLDLYSKCYDDQSEATEINKAVSEDLKGFAEYNKLNPKAVKAGYKTYKSYRGGSIDPNDDAFSEISSIVEDSFGAE